MAFTIFYAWQSDRPNNLCRGLIRRALDEARRQLEDDLDIQDAVRGELVVDQDTQDIAGSPQVAETIFHKIRECNVFIADLTPTLSRPNSQTAPNPNILIEYGYALHALGDQRIVGVFNEAFGKAEELPFDLRHRRWPIRYRVREDDKQETRQDERQRLASNLASAIRSIIRTFAESDRNESMGTSHPDNYSPAALRATPQKPESVAMITGNVAEQFPWDGGLVLPNSSTRIGLREAPTIYLNLRSLEAEPTFDNVNLQRIAWASLQPLASYRSAGRSLARSRNGAAVFASSNTEPPVALTASILARDGSLHGVDCYHLRVDHSEQRSNPYLPTAAVEEVLIDGLANFMSVAEQQLTLVPPLEVSVGLEDVEGFKLAVDRSKFSEEFIGPILVERIDDQFAINSYTSNPFDLLLPFFQRIYDEAGYERPDVRTVGMSQR